MCPPRPCFTPTTLALALVASLAACQSGPKAAGTLTDDAGRAVELTKAPERIVSLAPEVL